MGSSVGMSGGRGMGDIAVLLAPGLWRSNLNVSWAEARRLVTGVMRGRRGVVHGKHPLRNSKMAPERLASLDAALGALESSTGFIRWEEVARAISDGGIRDGHEFRSSTLRSICLHAPVYIYHKPGAAVTESQTLIAARLPDADGVLLSVVRELRDIDSKTQLDLKTKLESLHLDAMLRLASRPRDRQLLRAALVKIAGPTLAAGAGLGSTSGSRRETFRRAIARVDEPLGSMSDIEQRAKDDMEAARCLALERAAASGELANKYESLGRTKWVAEMAKHAESQRRRAEALSLGSAGGTHALNIRIRKALLEVCLVAVVRRWRMHHHALLVAQRPPLLCHRFDSITLCWQDKLSIDHRDRGHPKPYLVVYTDLKERIAALSALTGARADPRRRSLELQLIDKVTYEWIAKQLGSKQLGGEPIFVSASWLKKHRRAVAITATKIAKIDLPSEIEQPNGRYMNRFSKDVLVWAVRNSQVVNGFEASIRTRKDLVCLTINM